jgi:hypothetical protein
MRKGRSGNAPILVQHGTSNQALEDCKPGQKEGSLMLDIIVLALALLLGSGSTTPSPITSTKGVGNRPPAGGIPIPQRGPGLDAQ